MTTKMELCTCHAGKACCGSCANYEVLPDYFVPVTSGVFPDNQEGVDRGKLSGIRSQAMGSSRCS
jgi:hypothetical protein